MPPAATAHCMDTSMVPAPTPSPSPSPCALAPKSHVLSPPLAVAPPTATAPTYQDLPAHEDNPVHPVHRLLSIPGATGTPLPATATSYTTPTVAPPFTSCRHCTPNNPSPTPSPCSCPRPSALAPKSHSTPNLGPSPIAVALPSARQPQPRSTNVPRSPAP